MSVFQLHCTDCAAICRRCCYKKRKKKLWVDWVFSAARHFFAIYAAVKTIGGPLVPYQQNKWQLVFFHSFSGAASVFWMSPLASCSWFFNWGEGGVVVTVLFTILLFLNAVTGWGEENLKLHFHWQTPENFFKSQSIPVANGNINSFLLRRAFYQNRKDEVQTFFFFF